MTNTTFWITKFTTGSSTIAPMSNGRVNNVSSELNAVRLTERATFPPANEDRMLLELPPGQHDSNISPMNISDCRSTVRAMANDNAGNSNIWPVNPAKKGRGRRATITKCTGLSPNPRSNISSVRIGKTMSTEFMAANVSNFS